MIRAALTVEEALEGMKSLEPKIKNYARLVVRMGVNVKPGQEVVVQSPVVCAPSARVVVENSYFEQTPEWKRLQLDSLAQDGACFIFIEGADPAALKGIDPAKPAAASKAKNTQCKVFRR